MSKDLHHLSKFKNKYEMLRKMHVSKENDKLLKTLSEINFKKGKFNNRVLS